MKKPQAELLAPAGSLATLKAVAAAGADAVYAGGVRFGARAYAGNLTEEELLYAIDYLHIHGKRLYLTVNTLLKEAELSRELYDYIRPLYEQGLDGVIVQDIGVLRFLRERFPGMELHASTQMTVTGVPGARLMKKLGCSRVVTARELSLMEIRAIHESVDIEIESFVHGALCYCYSGQCLLSSMLGGRSGNRGRCAQPCRLPYQVKGVGEGYFLSPKDLCAIELLPQILESGVYSLKIEGRMKQTEYAAGVTGIYREYLDRYLASPESYAVSEKDKKRLLALGNRSGFTNGYYQKHNDPDMMAMRQPSHTKAEPTRQEQRNDPPADVEIQEKINGILSLSKENPACLVLQYKDEAVSVEGDTVSEAQNRPLLKADVMERMKKTGGTGFVFERLDIEMEEDVFLPVGALNQLRREGIGALQEKLLAGYRRRTEEESVVCPQCERKQQMGGRENLTANLAVFVQTIEQCRSVLPYSYIDRIYIDSGAFERRTELAELSKLVQTVHQAGKKLFYVMPMILRGENVRWYEEHRAELSGSGIDGIVAGNYESLSLFGEESKTLIFLADSSLYAWTGQAAEALWEAGADEITLAVEANEGELRNRQFSGGELIIYGYLPLMVSAQCLVKNTAGMALKEQKSRNQTCDTAAVREEACDAVENREAAGCTGKAGFTFLTDRYGKQFAVKNQCKYCYNILYNTRPLSLLHQYEAVRKLAVSGYRISFTRESEAEMRQILEWYEQGFQRGEPIDRSRYLSDYTNGHFKRGAE